MAIHKGEWVAAGITWVLGREVAKIVAGRKEPTSCSGNTCISRRDFATSAINALVFKDTGAVVGKLFTRRRGKSLRPVVSVGRVARITPRVKANVEVIGEPKRVVGIIDG